MSTPEPAPPAAIALAGPTASGKTAGALALAAVLGRQGVPVEIVSVDSALVYRGMDIGTAKPTPEERAAVPHHLIDIRDPLQPYSAAEFVRDATRLIAEIRARGALPLLVGGTMLYFKALREGLDELPQADPQVRARLDQEAARDGVPALHARLATLDPASAARLHPTDSQRIQRALEIIELSGQPMSALLAQRSAPELPFELLPLALEPSDRAVLHQRVAARFDAMLAGGLIDEVATLRARGDLHAGLPSMRCVGYRQVWSYLDGADDRAGMREKGIAATRQLVKRQLTWLRALPQRQTFDCLAPDAPARLLQAIDIAWKQE